MIALRDLRRPTNFANSGKSFEHILDAIFRQYAGRGIMRLKKVDPPTKTLSAGNIIHLQNPFLDFVGTWTARGGRAVFIEAKSTSQKERKNLSFGPGGLTDNQISSLQQWHSAGAVVCVLWENHGEVRLATSPMIDACLNVHSRHIEWDACHVVKRGMGFNIWNIAGIMEAVWPS